MYYNLKQECIPAGYLLSAAVVISPATHAPCHPCPLLPCTPLSHHAHPLCHACSHCGQNDRRLWKHYLSATTVGDDNNRYITCGQQLNLPAWNPFPLTHSVWVYWASRQPAASCWQDQRVNWHQLPLQITPWLKGDIPRDCFWPFWLLIVICRGQSTGTYGLHHSGTSQDWHFIHLVYLSSQDR